MHSIVSVVISGPANGLSLLLNVEQYEYVLGTKSAVGARITVQEPGQVAWVAEKGVDLAVGMYTAVELEPITVITVQRVGLLNSSDKVCLNKKNNYHSIVIQTW